MLIQDKHNANFMRYFEATTDYILYAVTVCIRLRVSEEIAHRSRLRWYSILADLYDHYKQVVDKIPSLKDDDKRVKEASELEGKKKDKLRRKALAKEVMEDDGGKNDEDHENNKDYKNDKDHKNDEDYEKKDNNEDGKVPDGDAGQALVEDNGGNYDDDEDNNEMDIDRKKDGDYEKSEDHENNEKENNN
ncbi:hypothetical protein RclHR1_21760002 [Rhizophagus clarus]|uniref:Uncharacterized protein n=1 Tax=Rhizophagus clarus TaxID=94130 RepID=A0A2Z6QTU6_9GLOM|nr:hypothetical protein RclHR1_21760002 [Rhizophagus clarus]